MGNRILNRFKPLFSEGCRIGKKIAIKFFENRVYLNCTLNFE